MLRLVGEMEKGRDGFDVEDEYVACGYFRFAPIVRDARLISFTRDLAVGQKLFLCRVGRGLAPLDLPVLIPRVKNGLPRGTRAALCERQPLQMPINAVAARGGCVCALCRPSAVVSAIRGESRRFRRRKKSAAVSVLTSSPEICRAFLARAIRYQSVLLWL